MKKIILPTILSLVSLSLTSCFTLISSIATQQPDHVYVQSTQPVAVVTTPAPQPQTTIVTTTVAGHPTHTEYVQTYDYDYYRSLDLRAVAAALAQSTSVRDFEERINSKRYMVSNLDLNHDGWIDYLRVIETKSYYNHVLVIQAVLAHNVFENVATIVVEAQPGRQYVQIIGEPYIYGANYIIEPVFRTTPPMFSYMNRSNYTCWHSPYYWDYYPSYYTRPQPVYVTHYEAYVVTYLEHHDYCREVHYSTHVHYNNYAQQTADYIRHDYTGSRPNESFSARNRDVTNVRGVSNMGSSTRQPAATMTTTTTTTTSSSTRQPAATTTTTTTTSTRQPATTTTNSSTRQPAATTTTTNSSTRQPATTTTTRQPAATTTTTRQQQAQPVQQSTTTRVQSNGRATTTRQPAQSTTTTRQPAQTTTTTRQPATTTTRQGSTQTSTRR